METHTNNTWAVLRSDIYIRDKGICWICNSFVDLNDYDLGHLVDRCNGGHDDYDNLAVMHKRCNLSKPRHTSLEEAMKWKLTPSYLTNPIRQAKYIESSHRYNLERASNRRLRKVQRLFLPKDDVETVKALVIEYFANHEELLVGNTNRERSEAIRQLSSTLNCPIQYIRKWIVEEGFVNLRIIVADGSQYRYISEHLEALISDYKTIIANNSYKPNAMGLNHYGTDIMLYLAGMPDRVSPCDFHKIDKRVKQLGLPIKEHLRLD